MTCVLTAEVISHIPACLRTKPSSWHTPGLYCVLRGTGQQGRLGSANKSRGKRGLQPTLSESWHVAFFSLSHASEIDVLCRNRWKFYSVSVGQKSSLCSETLRAFGNSSLVLWLATLWSTENF